MCSETQSQLRDHQREIKYLFFYFFMVINGQDIVGRLICGLSVEPVGVRLVNVVIITGYQRGRF